MKKVNINDINPYIRVATHSVLPKNTVIKERSIFDYELIYIESGRLSFNYGGNEYFCQEGDFLFIRPSIAHSFKCNFGDVSQPHIHFDLIYDSDSLHRNVSFKRLRDMSPEERRLISDDLFGEYSVTPFIKITEKEKALALFYNIVSDFYDGRNLLSAKANMIALISMLILDNFPSFFSSGSLEYNVCEQIKDFIDAGQGFSMTLDDFENQFSYNKFYLERSFKKRYGCSLIAYRNEVRLMRSLELLKTKTVTEVVSSLSYSSIYSFSRAFKNRFLCSPNHYKRGL